ncbi:MAG: SURF1 family protein [Paracoccaceae bacterium]|jgi:surfeit locus 1 family protein
MRRILFLIFGLAGLIVLLSLGIWQVQRLMWKQGLLAEIDARIGSAPNALPGQPDAETYRFLPVEIQGIVGPEELHVLSSIKQVGAVYRVISPFQTEDGRRILLDQGVIATTRKDEARPHGRAQVVGNLHWPDETDSFTPEPDVAKNIWFARDLETMAQALNTEPLMVVAREPVVSGTFVTPNPIDSAGVPNDHLQYAFTWFSLAVIWAATIFFFLRRRRDNPKEPGQ